MTRQDFLELMQRADALTSAVTLELDLDQSKVARFCDAVDAFKSYVRTVYSARQAKEGQ